jgi:hypothetical protein
VKRSIFASVLATLVVLAPSIAYAWEPETTHAGLAEQAALNSKLHKRLVNLGFSGGLFEPLTIPPADAPALIAAVKLLSPTHGSVPDARGRQAALSWLTAGAALADIPAAHGANHFYDPDTRRGWQKPDRGVIDGVTDRVREAIGRADLPEKGIAAPDWVTAAKNPFNLEAFYAQYGKAVSAKTPGERSRHMASALVAAGGILHALGDLGSPSRVRGDELAHLDPLGAGPDDLGSRFERIAALAHGRLGVPAPSRKIERGRVREFFTATDGGGLADLISRSYFSPNTLPGESRIGSENRPPLARAKPALPTRLNLMAASRDDGTTFRNSAGTCLARYKVDHGVLSFWMDDECMLEQASAILPEVAAYEAGLLDFLLRGELTIAVGQTVVVSGKELGAGTVEILVEDERGVRTSLGTAPTQGATETAALANVGAPSSGTRVLAVFRGLDRNGEPMVATGVMPLSQ